MKRFPDVLVPVLVNAAEGAAASDFLRTEAFHLLAGILQRYGLDTENGILSIPVFERGYRCPMQPYWFPNVLQISCFPEAVDAEKMFRPSALLRCESHLFFVAQDYLSAGSACAPLLLMLISCVIAVRLIILEHIRLLSPP